MGRAKPVKPVEHKARIVVDGVELTVAQTVVKQSVYVRIYRVVARDRKRKLDVTSGIATKVEDALSLVALLRSVTSIQTARCTCDYCRGYSDHAEHCRSLFVATHDECVPYD